MNPLRARAWLPTLAVAVALLGLALDADARSSTSSPADSLTRAPQKSKGSGVQVEYRVEPAAGVGQPATATIAFTGVSAPEGASVRFSTDPALTMGEGAAAMQLPAGRTTTIRVSVIPSAEGLAYLNVFTTQGGLTSSTSIPVQTGKARAAKKPPGTVSDAPEGGKVLSIPVR